MRNARNIEKKRGLAAVEVALLLPVFMLLMMGIMDGARLYWTRNVVQDAAFEGARMAILFEPSNTDIETYIAEELSAGGVKQSATVAIGARESDEPVQVSVSVPFEFFIMDGFIPSLTGSKFISATAVMTHER